MLALLSKTNFPDGQIWAQSLPVGVKSFSKYHLSCRKSTDGKLIQKNFSAGKSGVFDGAAAAP
ncbi:MAG: hypothetical protein J6D22_04420 [Pyramidobacter sp.]|nr:hypothetical protein [Pyramidobacter sp.]